MIKNSATMSRKAKSDQIGGPVGSKGGHLEMAIATVFFSFIIHFIAAAFHLCVREVTHPGFRIDVFPEATFRI